LHKAEEENPKEAKGALGLAEGQIAEPAEVDFKNKKQGDLFC